MTTEQTPRRYDPLARLRDGDWSAYGCTDPDCTDDHTPHLHTDASATDCLVCGRRAAED